ncbi:MAG TPA: cyclase family protein [Clostridiaceae bacterium]|nr:cyclase family protein [Clostridiaceae bacterium]
MYRNIIDISRSINQDTILWPGDTKVNLVRGLSVRKGDICNTSNITMSLHTGTHIDAPLHFFEGDRDVSSMDLSHFIGTVKIFELLSVSCITEDDVRGLFISEGDAVFFKTSNSNIPEDEPFRTDYVYMDENAAKFLVDKKIRTVGIDYLSIEKYETKDFPVHKIFLSNNIAIIEGLILKDVEPGQYLYCCMPLKIVGGEASPVRAVLAHY